VGHVGAAIAADLVLVLPPALTALRNAVIAILRTARVTNAVATPGIKPATADIR
jgi:hypothetical protein